MTRTEVYVLCDMTQTFDTDMTPKQLPQNDLIWWVFFFFGQKPDLKKLTQMGISNVGLRGMLMKING